MNQRLTRHLPILSWARSYSAATLTSDLVAAAIVTLMLVPQSLAYAMIAGLPPEVGLYASIAPLIAYALFGTSRVLAVGPVAVVSLMSAQALADVAATGSASYVAAAATLAALSGGMLLVMGIVRLGFLANFLSHPVVAGFIAASALLIAAGQLRHILGVPAGGDTLIAIMGKLAHELQNIHAITLALGAGTIGFLVWVRRGLAPLLMRLGASRPLATLIARTGPIFALVLSAGAVALFDLGAKGVALVGAVPAGLPPVGIPGLPLDLVTTLWLPALLISVVGFVESVSVGHTLAARRRERIDPDQELIGLGAANIASSLTGGYPVTGGFARSVVNADAGAETPAAGAFAAVGLALASLFLTAFFAYLPLATLAATIIVAVLSLVDVTILRRSWRYALSDFIAVVATIGLTLAEGVEAGIVAGVALSILFHLFKTSRPHFAVIGRVPGTEHFRNVKRHSVETSPSVLSIRVDESLYFANARTLENRILAELSERPEVRHIILACPAVNDVDLSALEALETLNAQLKDAGVTFHLSEVKGPVMDKLAQSGLLEHLTGRVFLTQHQATEAVLKSAV